MKKKQPDETPVWFDGKSINEALFCEEFLQTHKLLFTNGAFLRRRDVSQMNFLCEEKFSIN